MRINTKGRFSFPGGIYPPENKELTSESRIQPGPAVKQVAIMLSQHTGAVCQPLVREGNIVQAGQKIGDSDAFISAPVHSPIDGRVKEISLRSHLVLGRSLAIIIEPHPHMPTKRPRPKSQELFQDGFDIDPPKADSPQQICVAVRQAGIVGMGGAGFPTRVKIEPNPRLPKETLIINGCECEPYMTCDYRIMLEWTNQIIAGVKLARKASGCSKVFIGIEDNKPEAIEVMNAALHPVRNPEVKVSNGAKGKISNGVKTYTNNEDIKVVPVKTKYPQGGERQLIKAILNKDVPAGGIPPMIGVVVLNVATVAAIAEAVVCDWPLTHRVVTVTGEAIANPGNYYVPIGTSVAELIEFCGGVTESCEKVIIGGPMMGIAIADLTTPITKTTGAITVLTRKQIAPAACFRRHKFTPAKAGAGVSFPPRIGVRGKLQREAKIERRQTACIRCGRCIEVCPENLNPTKIAHAVKNNLLDVAESYYMSACTECGCCSYVCPANMELTGYIKTGKIFLARQKKKIPE